MQATGQPADPFADLDTAHAAQQATTAKTIASAKDPFSDLDPAPSATMASTAASPFVGFNKGLANTLGAPGDFINWGEQKLGLQPAGSQSPVGSDAIKRGLGLIGANPDDHAPRNEVERILQAGGEGVAAAILPEAGLAGAGRAGIAAAAPRVTEALQGAFGSAASAPAVAGNAASGLVAGAAAQGAEDAAPDQYKPLAALAGGLAGGLGAGLTIHGAGAVAGYGADAARDLMRPITGRVAPVLDDAGNAVRGATGDLLKAKPGQIDMAGQMLASKAVDAPSALDALQTAPREIVPGSKPTTFQLTGDMGLGGLERTVANSDNDTAALFQQRRADQNAARVGAMEGVEKNGIATDLPKTLRQQLAALDEMENGKVAGATRSAQTAASALGGLESPGFYGRQIVDQVRPQVNEARDAATAATQALGVTGTPEAFGSQMRGAEQAAKDAARQQRSALYRAIDPDGTLNAVVTDARQEARDLFKSISKMATPPSGEEAAIFGQLRSMPDVIRFQDLQAMDSRITAAMSAERRTAGESPVWGRLSQLKNTVRSAITDGVANQIAYERHGIATGQTELSEAGLEARIREMWKLSNVGAAKVRSTGRSDGAASDYLTSVQPAGAAGDAGTTRAVDASGGRSGQAAGDPGLPPPAPLEPNFDGNVADRLTAAKEAHASFAQTFKQGATAQRLQTTGFDGQYRMTDAAVPATVFGPGAKGAQQVQGYLRAAGDTPVIRSLVENYAAMSLRRAAERSDGTLDPARFARWSSSHQDALRALPGLAERFATASRASEALERFHPFTADLAPSSVPEMFFHSGVSGGDGVHNLRQMVGDEQATRVLSDYAAGRLRHQAIRPDGTLDPAKVAQFVKAHDEALTAIPGLRDRFATASKASEAISEAALARKAAMDDFQVGKVGQLIGANDVETIRRTVAGIFGQRDAVQQMKRLAGLAGREPEALMGLRRAIADHIGDQFLSNAEAGTSGVRAIKADGLQTFIRKNEAVLAQVFKSDELKTMKAVAADLQRANRSIVAVKNPGGSNTTQDLRSANAHDPHGTGSLGGSLWKAAVVAGEVTGPLSKVAVAASFLGKHLLGSMRNAGLRNVNDLVKEALLNPDLAQALLQRASKVPDRGSQLTLAQKLNRLSMFAAVNAARPQPAPAP